MWKIVSVFLFGCSWGTMAFGQTPDSAVWTLTAHQSAAVTGTEVSAAMTANTPIGYASLNGGTSGGAGGLATTVTTLAELVDYAKSCEKSITPKILFIKGKISAPTSTVITIKHGASISVLGEGSFGELENVGLMFWDYQNVIVRNMKIHEVIYPNDALNIDQCQNVWIDHNELYSRIGAGITVDTYDGLLDIKSGSRYVTVSWNYLHHHMKCSLIGHTDNTNSQAVDAQMRITYHHNLFSHTDGRNPSIRYGAIHMFNNYFEDITDYGIAARDGAHAKIENSHYHNVTLPMSTDKFPVTGLPNGYIYETGNSFTGTCGANVISQTDSAFWNNTTLPYAYTVDPVENVESMVKLNAGIGITTSATQSLPDAPRMFELQQNFPNPFNPVTTIRYTLQQNSNVTLTVYDILGNSVQTLVHQKQAPGAYAVRFDGSGVCSGIYFYRLNSGSFSAVKKFALMK